jgi:hypothetical protein
MKTFFESPRRAAVPIHPQRDAQPSDCTIRVEEYIFIVPHLTRIVHIVPSDEMPRCIVERANRATSKFNNYAYSSVSMITTIKWASATTAIVSAILPHEFGSGATTSHVSACPMRMDIIAFTFATQYPHRHRPCSTALTKISTSWTPSAPFELGNSTEASRELVLGKFWMSSGDAHPES